MGKKRKKYRASPTASIQPSDPPNDVTAPVFNNQPDPLRWAILVLLLIVGIGFYFTSFGNSFIWDDTMVITPNEYIRDWSYLKEIFTSDIHHFGLDKSNFYRPFQAISYTIDHMFWGLKPMGFHISSALFHILNAFLIFLVFPSALSFLDPKIESRARDIGIGVALVWLVHPIHTQAVTYAAGRADELVAMFILLTLFAFMRGKRILSWVCFAGALLSKEFGVITPAFVLLFDFFGLTVNKEGRWKKIIPFLLIFGVYAALRLTVLSYPQEVSTAFIPGMYGRLLTSVQSMIILLGLLVAPFDLSMDRNIPWVNTVFHWRVIVPGVIVLGMMAAAWCGRKKFPVISFGLFFYFVGYLLVLNIIKMNANVSEHWMYMPSIGIWIVLFYLMVNKIPWMKRSVWFSFLAVFVVYLGFFLVKRNADFKNEIVFYNQILNRTYNDARVHYNLGCAYFYEGEMEKSRLHLSEAIKFKPDYAAAYGNLGQLEYRDGNLDEAIRLYERANQIKPDLVENRANLGTAYSEAGRFREAVEQLQYALKLNPKHIGALNNMGIAYGRIGQFDASEKYFRMALQINSNDPSAQKNLAHVQFLRQKTSQK